MKKNSLTNQEYTKRINELFNRNKELLLTKRNEYATDEDPLQNFKDAAEMSGKKTEEVLWYFCLKHLVSVRDIIFNKSIEKVSKQTLEEKTGDIINYMTLLNLLRDDKMKSIYFNQK